MLDLNVVAVCMCVQLTIKSLTFRGVEDGQVKKTFTVFFNLSYVGVCQIILINSSAGHSVPASGFMHFYSATKYAMTSLCEGFRQEVIID